MNILFTGIGGPTPLGLARSVKAAFPEARCVGVDGSPWAPSLYHSEVYDSTHCIVAGTDPRYWEIIGEVIEREAIDFAFIVPETEVLVWSERQSRQDLPCPAYIPALSLAEFCFDKHRVGALLHPMGLAPQTLAFDETAEGKSPLPYPYWIRVKSGAGALGALKVNTQKDLDTWRALHNYRSDFIVSEYLPGRNYACKLLYVNGELVQHASAERIDYLLSAAAPSGISGMCGRGRLLNRPDLVERSVSAMDAVSGQVGETLHGIFTVDFKENTKGEPMITEINIRHVSFNHAFAIGGINFAETTLCHALNLASSSGVSTEFSEEAYFVRGVDAPLRLIPEDKLSANL